jgi:SprT-like protein
MKKERTDISYSKEIVEGLANKLSLHFWNHPCTIPVVWNGRLTSSMGRFIFSIKGKIRIPVKIELSKHAAQFINRDIFIGVMLHELCHYHLCRLGQPFDDHHPVFEKELARVGAISTNTVQIPQKAFQLLCSKCNKSIGVRKRINTKNYRSACCKEKIIKKDTWVGTFTYDGKILKNTKVRVGEEI